MPTDVRAESRRQFLRFLAESPLLYGMGGALAATTAFAQDDAAFRGAYDFKGLIKSPDDALNVWDFEAVMRERFDPGHVAYLAQGSDDLGTIAANRNGYKKLGLRPRRLADVGNPDMSVELFGQRLNSPIFLCPWAPRPCSTTRPKSPSLALPAARTRSKFYRPSPTAPSRT